MEKRIVKLSTGTRNHSPRYATNAKLANEYRDKGYEVIQNGYPLNAFVAIYPNKNPHTEFERKVCEIFAENGISMTLEKDGAYKIKLKDGRSLEAPALDGIADNTLTHEIMALTGKPSVDKVVEGISHSFKVWKHDKNYKLQADIAITFTPLGTKYDRTYMDKAATEFKRLVKTRDIEARPRIWLHVDEGHRKIFYRNIQ